MWQRWPRDGLPFRIRFVSEIGAARSPPAPRSCQHSHQLSVAQIAVTAADVEVDAVALAADARDKAGR